MIPVAFSLAILLPFVSLFDTGDCLTLRFGWECTKGYMECVMPTGQYDPNKPVYESCNQRCTEKGFISGRCYRSEQCSDAWPFMCFCKVKSAGLN